MIYISSILMLSAVGGGLALLLVIADRFIANYGPCDIKINDRDPFTVDGGKKLLDELYAQKIFIPSACGGQGTCGFCKVRVLSGGGPVLPTETPYLSCEETRNDTRLACQVKVKEDMQLHVREDFLNVKEFKAQVSSTKPMTHDTREIVMKLIEPEEVEFKPGQYVQVMVPGTKEMTFRAYSICNAPSNKREIELLVRLIPGGLGSTYLHELQEGEELTITGPYGEFILDEEPDNEVICVGGGCGMAPMRCIIRYIQETAPERSCHLYFGARTEEDLMYVEEFNSLTAGMPNFQLHFALSEPDQSPGWTGETGFIHKSVEEHLGEEGRRQAFLCGPPLMIEAVKEVLQAKGVSAERTFYDEF